MNEYEIKDIATTAGSDLVNASMMGDGLGGYDLGNDMFGGIDSPSADYVSDAMSSGNTGGLKTALGAALKVISENDMSPGLPPDSSSDVMGYISHGAVETAGTLSKVATGAITMAEGEAIIQNTTVSTVAAATKKVCKEIGQKIGGIFGLPGRIIGGLVGTAVGHLAGTKVGQAVYNGAKKVVSHVAEKVKSFASKAVEKVKNVGKKILSFFGF